MKNTNPGWLKEDNLDILFVDYSRVENTSTLLQLVKTEILQCSGDTVYTLQNFGKETYDNVFRENMYWTLTEILKAKKLVCACVGLPNDSLSYALGIEETIKDNKGFVEIFDTEAAALKWLLSFGEIK